MSILYQVKGIACLIFIALFLTLYITSPQGIEPRSVHQFWNLGHVVLFFLLSTVILLERRQQHSSLRAEAVEALLYPLLFGVSIELLQPAFARTADLSDLLKNIAGSLLAFCWFSDYLAKNYKALTGFLRIVSIIALLAAFKPLVISRYDEYLAQQHFPLLSNFDSSTEISRFKAIGKHTLIHLDHKAEHLNSQALAIRLHNKEQYSGASLEHFPGNWQNYHSLRFSLYTNHQQTITLRIYDKPHPERGFDYNDRFNKKLLLTPGWNHLSVDLAAVAAAPSQRRMDMANIIDVSFFITNASPQTLWLDQLYLQ